MTKKFNEKFDHLCTKIGINPEKKNPIKCLVLETLGNFKESKETISEEDLKSFIVNARVALMSQIKA